MGVRRQAAGEAAFGALRPREAFAAELSEIKSPDVVKRGSFSVGGGLGLCLHPKLRALVKQTTSTDGYSFSGRLRHSIGTYFRPLNVLRVRLLWYWVVTVSL